VKDLIVQLAVVGTERIADLDRRFAALVDAQIKSEDHIAKLAEANTRLVEGQAHTDERLSALIDVVDRWIRERRNGQSAPGVE
jgi:hypothetical protein